MSEVSNKTDKPITLPTGKALVLSSSPHVSAHATVRGIMFKVFLALLFPAIAGIYFFGIPALITIILTTVFCVGAEALWCFLANKPIIDTISDCSAAVTGLLLALNLPPAVPFYIPLIGAFLAIWLGKQVYGGLGNNPFNPAIVARVGLLIALPAAMTYWVTPRDFGSEDDKVFVTAEAWQNFNTKRDATTCATPLSIASMTKKLVDKSPEAKNNFKHISNSKLLKEYFWGVRAGCIGETCVPALLLGCILLIIFNLINWRVPICFASTVAIITGIVNYFYPGVTPTPLFHVLTGGLLLGAIFMATDMVTSPITGTGCLVFAIGCGIITSVIRIWGNYPEGVSFAILFMNALVPLIDRVCGKRPFGYTVIRKAEAKK